MSKKILLIENDAAFAAEVSRVLEQTGFDVRVTGEGKDGLDLAREWGPTAIVLSVELPGMSGYLVCQKLRKDDALKSIPLVLTSAEATADTFEKHRALKVRADAYHLKPYAPDALVETLGGLVGLPEGGGAEEELVSLEEEMGLEALPVEPDAELPELDLQSLPEEAAAGAGTDEALSLLDDAFDGLTTPAPRHAEPPPLELDLGGDKPLPLDEVDAAEASLPDAAGAERDALGTLDDESEAALGALGADEPLASAPRDDELSSAELDLDRALEAVQTLAPAADPAAELDRELESPRPSVRGASADLLRAAGIRLLHPEAPATAPARGHDAAATTIQRLEGELRQARARGDEASRRAEEAESALSEKDVELAGARSRADAAIAQARKIEADLKAAREESRELETLREKLAAAERRADAADARATDAAGDARRKGEALATLEAAAARADALERELDELRGELVVARGEADGARGEIERQSADLQKHVAELEAANAKHEERVLKAYQKIKNDEKVKDKVRKAIAIAAQLLEEGLPAETPAEKERRTAAATALGRE